MKVGCLSRPSSVLKNQAINLGLTNTSQLGERYIEKRYKKRHDHRTAGELMAQSRHFLIDFKLSFFFGVQLCDAVGPEALSSSCDND